MLFRRKFPVTLRQLCQLHWILIVLVTAVMFRLPERSPITVVMGQTPIGMGNAAAPQCVIEAILPLVD